MCLLLISILTYCNLEGEAGRRRESSRSVPRPARLGGRHRVPNHAGFEFYIIIMIYRLFQGFVPFIDHLSRKGLIIIFYKFCPNPLTGGIHKDKAPASRACSCCVVRPLSSARTVPVLWYDRIKSWMFNVCTVHIAAQYQSPQWLGLTMACHQP